MQPISHIRPTPMPPRAEPARPLEGQGKPDAFGAAAVGQQAKTAIAGAADPAALPHNIQGKVASSLARGLPIEALLAVQSEASPQPPAPEASAPVPGEVDTAAP